MLLFMKLTLNCGGTGYLKCFSKKKESFHKKSSLLKMGILPPFVQWEWVGLHWGKLGNNSIDISKVPDLFQTIFTSIWSKKLSNTKIIMLMIKTVVKQSFIGLKHFHYFLWRETKMSIKTVNFYSRRVTYFPTPHCLLL